MQSAIRRHDYDPTEREEFDAVLWHLEHGELREAADAMHDGDSWRVSLLSLDAADLTALRGHLAKRRLDLIEDHGFIDVVRHGS